MTSKIQLACADFSFPLLPHELALDLIARLEIPAVDISLMAGYSHLDIEETLRQPSIAGKQLTVKLSDRDLVPADINYCPGVDFETLAVNHPDSAERSRGADQFRRAVEFAANASCHHLTILPGVLWPQEDPTDSRLRCFDELAWRLECAFASDIVMSVEAHVGSITPTPDATAELLGAVSDLTLTLDYTHFIYQGFSQADCDRLLSYASHFHARGGAPKRLQTTLKTSTIDYRRVLREMKRTNYSGYFAIEYVWLDWEGCNETDNVSETVLLRNLAREEI